MQKRKWIRLFGHLVCLSGSIALVSLAALWLFQKKPNLKVTMILDDLTPSIPVTLLFAFGCLGVILTGVHCLITLCTGLSPSMYIMIHNPIGLSSGVRTRLGTMNVTIPIAQVICAGLLLSNFCRIESKLRNDLVGKTGYSLSSLQSSMKCCGVTGRSDWDDWSNSHQGQLPVSCCPDSRLRSFGREKQCFPDFAFETDCMSIFKEGYGKRYLTIGVLGLVVPLVDFVVMTLIYFMDKDTFSKLPPAVHHVGSR